MQIFPNVCNIFNYAQQQLQLFGLQKGLNNLTYTEHINGNYFSFLVFSYFPQQKKKKKKKEKKKNVACFFTFEIEG